MPNRTLALDVGSTTIRGVVVESTLRSQRILGVYATPRTPGGNLAADLRTLAATHGLHWDEAVSVLPGDAVTHRILTLPFHDRKRLDQTVPFELESHLPFELEEGVVDYQVVGEHDGATAVLAVLASKAAVREHLAQLAVAGIEPRILDLASLAPLNLLRQANGRLGDAALLLTFESARTSVAVVREGRLAGLRTLSCGVAGPDAVDAVVRQVHWSLLALVSPEATPTPTLWIAGEGAGTPGLAAALEDTLGLAPQSLDALPVAAIPPTLRREQAAFATSLGLALRERTADGGFGIDLRRGEFAYHREREALWHTLAGTAALAVLALVLMVMSSFVEAHQLQARRDELRTQIRTLFTAALPGTHTIVNEKAQLEAAIASLAKERERYGGLAPSAPRTVDLLLALTEVAPRDVDLDLEELTLDGDALKLRGSTRAYEGVDALKRALQARPEFRSVQARDVRASVDGTRVAFGVDLEAAQQEAP
jgi:general secretion pathway protein L